MNRFTTLGLAAALFAGSSLATVIQTSGAGSAVKTIDATADFENPAALIDNPYSEGGMLFSRSGLTFDNNGCGFAGCKDAVGFQAFVGNYMYGASAAGVGGYFEIAAGKGNEFFGIEFTTGTGFPSIDNFIAWEAFDDAASVGRGSVALLAGTIIGFSDVSGFDVLRFTASPVKEVNFSTTANTPAFDSVTAQFSSNQVPEPTTLSLIGLALAGLGVARWRVKT